MAEDGSTYFRLVHNDRGQLRGAQGLRDGRDNLQGADLDAVELRSYQIRHPEVAA